MNVHPRWIEKAKTNYKIAVRLYGKEKADEMHGRYPRKEYEQELADKKNALVEEAMVSAVKEADDIFVGRIRDEYELEQKHIKFLALEGFQENFNELYSQKMNFTVQLNFLEAKKAEISAKEREFISCYRGSPASNAAKCDQILNEKEQAKSQEIEGQIEALRALIGNYDSQIAQNWADMDTELNIEVEYEASPDEYATETTEVQSSFLIHAKSQKVAGHQHYVSEYSY